MWGGFQTRPFLFHAKARSREEQSPRPLPTQSILGAGSSAASPLRMGLFFTPLREADPSRFATLITVYALNVMDERRV
jgi:hypothetical protein